GRTSVCLSNLRELGLAVRYYGDANDDRVVSLLETETGYLHWIEQLQPYVHRADICRCPGDRSQKWEANPFEPHLGLRTTSFATNHRMSPEMGLEKLGRVLKPSRTIFFAEYKDDTVGDHFHPESWELFLSWPEDELALRRHRER